MKVRLMPDDKVKASSDNEEEDIRTHILQYTSIRQLVSVMSVGPSHIEGDGNGSVNIVGCE